MKVLTFLRGPVQFHIISALKPGPIDDVAVHSVRQSERRMRVNGLGIGFRELRSPFRDDEVVHRHSPGLVMDLQTESIAQDLQAHLTTLGPAFLRWQFFQSCHRVVVHFWLRHRIGSILPISEDLLPDRTNRTQRHTATRRERTHRRKVNHVVFSNVRFEGRPWSPSLRPRHTHQSGS